MQAIHLYQSACELGEGPAWFEIRNSFMWADIKGRMLFEFNLATGQITQHTTPDMPSLLIPVNGDNTLVAMKGGIYKYHIDKRNWELIQPVEENIATNRTNDGGCDSVGRLWVGTLDIELAEGAGSLYSINTDRQLTKVMNHCTIPNGMAWTQDEKILYYIESTSGSVTAWDYDIRTGSIRFRDTVITIPEEMGSPDGMAIDTEGMLWIALYGGFAVGRWNPVNGKLLDKIELPVPNVTSCAFGGNEMNQLLITTARQELSAEQLKEYPQSGDVFMATTGVKGQKKYSAHHKK